LGFKFVLHPSVKVGFVLYLFTRVEMENQQIQKRRSQYIFLKNQVSPLRDDNIYDEEAQKTSIYKAGKRSLKKSDQESRSIKLFPHQRRGIRLRRKLYLSDVER
jgi:hypothetical protein